MPIKILTRLLIKAYEKQDEQKAWQLYLTVFPKMEDKNYKPFEEFYKPQKQVIKEKSQAEVLKEVKDIIITWRGGEKNGAI